jgi:hypothetical protein
MTREEAHARALEIYAEATLAQAAGETEAANEMLAEADYLMDAADTGALDMEPDEYNPEEDDDVTF